MIKVDVSNYKSKDLVPVICDRCGIEFHRKKQFLQKSIRLKRRTYCSTDCVKVDKDRTCEECNGTFEYTYPDQKFCSSSCSASHNNKLRGKKKVPCLNCGKSVKKKYCNQTCQWEHSWKTRISELDQNDISKVFNTNTTQKKYLIEIRGHACEVCGITEWQGVPAPLVLDHVNGNSDDNSLANLRLVCGNCDMQLPTYKSKNKGNGRHYRRQRYADGKSY